MKQPRHTTTRGFSRAATLLQSKIRAGTEGRGFTETRVLTHWPEIVGEQIATVAQPVSVSFSQGGMGATLVVLVAGAHAPMIEMQKDQIRDKVNACYGYRAIARVRVTQTAPTGFAEGRIAFGPAPKKTPPAPDPAVLAEARAATQGVEDDSLRLALQQLAANVLSKRHN